MIGAAPTGPTARDVVCLAATYHPSAASPASPWSVFLQGYSFVRLAGAGDRGPQRWSVADYAVETADTERDERRVLESLATRWQTWRHPVVVTVNGTATILPALRLRSLLLDVPLPDLHPPSPLTVASGFRRRMRATHLDIIDDLELPRAGTRHLPLPALLDQFGLAFSRTFQRWRHDPRAAVQIIAVATLVCFARRSAHDGTMTRAEAAQLVTATRGRAGGAGTETPWLDEVLRGPRG